ncbi:MAG: hypothetical protein VXZ36_12650 [Pseudomonadota bacterium]|uniref:hypothetical protein n=1 Tax=Alteromonas sp. S167 TaxID=3117402 RepID=UPI002EA31AEA|nr:hypothetical protein [Pseudomonadota bacterium]
MSKPKSSEPAPNEAARAILDEDICLFEHAPKDFEHNCDMRFWINEWVVASATSWSERKATIKEMGNSQYDIVRAYVLTLPNDTPYQDRLRAQLALDTLSEKFTASAKEVINVVAAEQNNQLMQLESALVVLEKENTQRGEALQQLRDDAVSLRKKLEELLQIEAALMDKNRSTQQ